MFKHYFERIEGIDFYPILSLLIFVLFFITLLIWVFRVNKGYVQDMSNLPLKEDQPGANRFNL